MKNQWLFRVILLIVFLLASVVFSMLLGVGPGLCGSAALVCLLQTSRLVFRMVFDFFESGDKASVPYLKNHAERDHEYRMVTRYLKDLEMDHATGKINPSDYAKMRQEYRERAVRLLQAMDQQPSMQQQIDADLALRRRTGQEAQPQGEPHETKSRK